jgi:hypothetical protein
MWFSDPKFILTAPTLYSKIRFPRRKLGFLQRRYVNLAITICIDQTPAAGRAKNRSVLRICSAPPRRIFHMHFLHSTLPLSLPYKIRIDLICPLTSRYRLVIMYLHPRDKYNSITLTEYGQCVMRSLKIKFDSQEVIT